MSKIEPESHSRKGLAVHEWIAVCSLITSLLTIATFSFFNKYTATVYVEKISVFVTGAVSESKQILLPNGSRVIDILSFVDILDEANIEKMPLQIPLHEGSKVIIPRTGVLSLYMSGAVAKEGVILVPEGLRFCDLIHHIVLDPQADMKWILRKKRILKEGECISIPQKKQNA